MTKLHVGDDMMPAVLGAMIPAPTREEVITTMKLRDAYSRHSTTRPIINPFPIHAE